MWWALGTAAATEAVKGVDRGNGCGIEARMERIGGDSRASFTQRGMGAPIGREWYAARGVVWVD